MVGYIIIVLFFSLWILHERNAWNRYAEKLESVNARLLRDNSNMRRKINAGVYAYNGGSSNGNGKAKKQTDYQTVMPGLEPPTGYALSRDSEGLDRFVKVESDSDNGKTQSKAKSNGKNGKSKEPSKPESDSTDSTLTAEVKALIGKSWDSAMLPYIERWENGKNPPSAEECLKRFKGMTQFDYAG